MPNDLFDELKSRPDNTVVLISGGKVQKHRKAVASSARSFAEDGYEVFVDCVVGPWHFDIYSAAFGAFDYAILDLDVATAVDRMRRRGDTTVEQEGVEMLWQFFREYPEVLAQYSLNAAMREDLVLREFERSRAEGKLRYAG